MIDDLKPPPMIWFFDLDPDLTFTTHQLVEAVLPGASLASFNSTIIYMVEDFLASLYYDAASPKQGIHLVQEAWRDPIPLCGMVTPEGLAVALSTAIGPKILGQLLAQRLALQVGTKFDPDLHGEGTTVAIVDADYDNIMSFFAPGGLVFDPAFCIAIRIRPIRSSITQLFAAVPCQSINLLVNPTMDLATCVNAIETAEVQPPEVQL